jgi:small-conductance mechanosensitive channel
MKKTTLYTLIFWVITLTLFTFTTYIALRGFLLWATPGMIIIVCIAYFISVMFYTFAKKELQKTDPFKVRARLSFIYFGLFLIINTAAISWQILAINRDHHWAFG